MAPSSSAPAENDPGLQRAIELDRTDPLRRFREEFVVPTKGALKSKTWPIGSDTKNGNEDGRPCIYFCGNSLGLQPRRTSTRVADHLSLWAEKAVHGHFVELKGKGAPTPFLHVDDVAAQKMAPIVGALRSEVAVMETLSANLHLLMASFYKPTKERYKIILEGKAFPSDNYIVQSQIAHHGLTPKDAMVLIEPRESAFCITTEQILATIEEHASSTALILLPGVQYYTGQFFDMQRITRYAQEKDLLIGWDLAHAVGNVELQLHDWGVDFGAWCTYKYLNSGPGAIAGLFIHEKHSQVESSEGQHSEPTYRPRLSGWWGNDKKSRFRMEPNFVPIPGAAGFQLGNPSALALTAVLASLEIFSQTTMKEIRTKSLLLTGFLETLLLESISRWEKSPYWIITPLQPEERGAQLSVQLEPGLLEDVIRGLEDEGVVTDERRPDVIRVAPVPLYNTYREVWEFVQIFDRLCRTAKA